MQNSIQSVGSRLRDVKFRFYNPTLYDVVKQKELVVRQYAEKVIKKIDDALDRYGHRMWFADRNDFRETKLMLQNWQSCVYDAQISSSSAEERLYKLESCINYVKKQDEEISKNIAYIVERITNPQDAPKTFDETVKMNDDQLRNLVNQEKETIEHDLVEHSNTIKRGLHDYSKYMTDSEKKYFTNKLKEIQKWKFRLSTIEGSMLEQLDRLKALSYAIRFEKKNTFRLINEYINKTDVSSGAVSV